MAQVTLGHIRKTFGSVTVLDDVSIDIEDGEFMVFVGPSGCGKTTLLRTIAGLERPSAGRVMIGADNVTAWPPARRGVAMVFQSYALYPHMTVRENIAFGLKLARVSQAEIDQRVREAAATLQIDHLLDRKPRELSGGQRQRVAIGRSIVRHPKVFLFDEPLSNLDAELRVQMRVELIDLHQRLRATMVYVTHDQIEAMTMADRIVVLHRGRVEQIGAPLELYQQPDNIFVAGFIGSPKMNFLPVTADAVGAEGVTVRLPGDLPLTVPVRPGDVRAGAPLTLGVRPEHLGLDGEGRADARLPAEAQVVEHLGSEILAHMMLPGGVALEVKATGESALHRGANVPVGVRAELCYLFTEAGAALAPLRPRPVATTRDRRQALAS
ncbi:MAG TPA: sn-glycerol-3-phosphate ABC transporter ATP-binding protein UgpC [Acetobacteraceae bacterium]|nr:sn-glycerol-3-phosphate ABC transporter ATP-binding protein UgpC [Acetobacteraceae bacterium]